MEVTFEDLISDSVSQSPTAPDSLQKRDQLLHENPLNFLIQLVDSALQTPNFSYLEKAITILYSISKHTNYITDPNISEVLLLASLLSLSKYVRNDPYFDP